MIEPSIFPPTFWQFLINGAVSLLLGIYVFMSSRNRATTDEIKSNNNRIMQLNTEHYQANSAMQERIAKIEGAITQMPGVNEFSDLRSAVSRTNGKIEAVDNRINSVETLLKQVISTTNQLLENELAEGRNNKVKGA